MMRVSVKVIPRSSQHKVVDQEDSLRIYVHASATDGKANKAVIELLAKYYSTAKSNISIVRGEKSREKVVDVNV